MSTSSTFRRSPDHKTGYATPTDPDHDKEALLALSCVLAPESPAMQATQSFRNMVNSSKSAMVEDAVRVTAGHSARTLALHYSPRGGG